MNIENLINLIKLKTQEKKINIFTISIVIIIFIIIIIILFIFREQNTGMIKIIDLDEYTQNVPEGTKEEILKNTYKTISQGNNLPSNTTGIIRDNSYSEEIEDSLIISSFIIDIESLKQSYRISYLWSNDIETQQELYGFNTSTTCLTPSEMIYPAFDCKNSDTSEDENPYVTVLNKLPFEKTFMNGATATVTDYSLSTSDSTPYFKVTITPCDDLTIAEQGVQYFKDYLASFGLNPEDYNISPDYFCNKATPLPRW